MPVTMAYENELAEAAWLTIQDVSISDPVEGLCASRGGQPGDPGWEGYVTVIPAKLAARGHHEVAEAILAQYWELTSFDVWITTDGQTVSLHSWGHDEGARSGTDALWASWDEQN